MAVPPLCPTDFLPSDDLSKGAFRRVVAHRARQMGATTRADVLTSEDARKEAEAGLRDEVVNLESDFLPAAFLRRGALRARAVCRIRVPVDGGMASGTGFLIAPGLIMTNNHVLPDAAVAEEAVAEFGFEAEGEPSNIVGVEPRRFFHTVEALDFTIVACDTTGIGDIEPIPLTRNPAIVTRHDRVNIIQHPRGRPKEVALQNNRVVRVRDTVIRYETDTEPGSSGSPVFDNSWQLVALHRAGRRLEGERAENEGVKLSSIVNHLLGVRAEREMTDPHLEAVLGRVAGSSPFLGFFDTAGLGRPGLEVELPDFSGTPDFADVGVWNIEHFNESVTEARVDAVADVVENLALDVFGLVEVHDDAMGRLRTELASRGLATDFRLLNVPGSQDLAVLFDTDTSTVELLDLSARFADQLAATTDAGRTAFPRPPLFARCRVEDGNGPEVDFIFIVVHLKAFGDPESQARRRLASEMLTEMIADLRDSEGVPVVLGGDFNDRLNTDVFSSLQDSPDLLALTADDEDDGAISFVGDSDRSLIDHFVVSADARLGDVGGDDAAIIRVDRSVADFSESVSDHVPIVFRMVFRDEDLFVGGRSGSGTAIAIPPGSTHVSLSFSAGAPGTDESRVRISALLPNPTGSDSGNETVSLSNAADVLANLGGWLLRDAGGNEHPLGALHVPAGETVVVALGGSLGLNNTGDTVQLVDRDGTVRDEVSYTGADVVEGEPITFP